METEADFLKTYNPAKYDKPSISTEILVFSVTSTPSADWRHTDKKNISILLIRRTRFPAKDKWNIPGGFLPLHQTCEESARYVLASEAGLSSKIFMKQFRVFDAINRDPRMRIISVSSIALVDKDKLDYQANRYADFFDIKTSKKKMIFTNGEINLTEDDLAFDHAEIIRLGLEELRLRAKDSDIVFNMMPTEFTLGELQQVFEVILDRKLLAAAFRRIIANRIVPTGRMRIGAGHRPSQLFKYKQR